MPYVKPTVRAEYDDAIEAFPQILSKGELNYAICRLMMQFAHANGHSPDYQRHSDAIAAATDAAAEYRRRQLDPLEDLKAAVNGDIFTIYAGTERI